MMALFLSRVWRRAVLFRGGRVKLKTTDCSIELVLVLVMSPLRYSG
jgi:hypothetical protein